MTDIRGADQHIPGTLPPVASVSFCRMGWAVYLHPVAMLAVVALGLLVLREGLLLRRARLSGERRESRRHTRLARPLVLLVAAGYLSGIASMVWLRRDPALESVHFWLATLATLCIGLAGTLGLRLERRVSDRARSIHLACGGAGLLIAIGAALAAFAILP